MDTHPKNPESVGPVLGIVIIIAILVVGGIFAFTDRLNNTAPTPEEIEASSDPSALELTTYSTSTDIATLEAEAEATNLDNLDADLAEIEAELR